MQQGIHSLKCCSHRHQGQFTDATLLDVSEVELADVKFLEDDPVIVVQFNCQQINCVRDKFGNVVDGEFRFLLSGNDHQGRAELLVRLAFAACNTVRFKAVCTADLNEWPSMSALHVCQRHGTTRLSLVTSGLHRCSLLLFACVVFACMLARVGD